MTGLVLAKARLRRDVPAVALAQVLMPADGGARTGTTHRLLWSLYADDPDRQRDFLWRETRPGEFLMLGSRVPVDQHALFELEHKPFAPALRPGQRLAFSLRANATRRIARGRYVDVVMHELQRVPRGERPAQRERVTHEAAAGWLQHIGGRAGFEPVEVHVAAYQQARVPHGRVPIQYSVLDLEGELIVRGPQAFVGAIGTGLGRARAFGCGLMLIRRC